MRAVGNGIFVTSAAGLAGRLPSAPRGLRCGEGSAGFVVGCNGTQDGRCRKRSGQQRRGRGAETSRILGAGCPATRRNTARLPAPRSRRSRPPRALPTAFALVFRYSRLLIARTDAQSSNMHKRRSRQRTSPRQAQRPGAGQAPRKLFAAVRGLARPCRCACSGRARPLTALAAARPLDSSAPAAAASAAKEPPEIVPPRRTQTCLPERSRGRRRTTSWISRRRSSSRRPSGSRVRTQLLASAGVARGCETAL